MYNFMTSNLQTKFHQNWMENLNGRTDVSSGHRREVIPKKRPDGKYKLSTQA